MRLWKRFWEMRRGLTASPVLPAAFASGLAIGLAHLAISLEIGVSLTYHKTFIRAIFLGLYPLGVSFMGLGALLERRLAAGFPARGVIGVSLRAAGISVLAFLVLALRVNFFVASLPELLRVGTLHLAALAAWFLSLGVAVASLLREAKRGEGACGVGPAWSAHLLGLLAGYAATDLLMRGVGPNAVLAAVGIALAASPRLMPLLLAAALAAAPALSLDGRIERRRESGLLRSERIRTMMGYPSESLGLSVLPMHRGTQEVLFQGWSRSGLVRIARMAGGEVRGFYNYVPQWEVELPGASSLPIELVWRQALYRALAPAQRILLLAAGGGRGISCLPFAPHKGVTAVELNEAVVGFFRDERPDLNQGYFRETTALAAEARFVVDTAREPFDTIVIESGRFQTAQMLAPAGNAMSLYTRETILRCLSRLRPGGLLLVLFDNIYPIPWLEYLPLQVVRTVSESGIPFRVAAAEVSGTAYVAVAASTDPAVLERVGRSAARVGAGLRPGDWRPRTAPAPCHRARLTDDRPFPGWHYLPRALKKYLLGAAGGLAGLSMLAAFWIGGPRFQPDPARGIGAAPFFFLIGAAQVMMLVGTTYAYRSFFGDPVLTALRLMIYTLACGALGALAAPRLLGLSRGRLLAWAAALLGLHAAGLVGIPFAAGPAWVREAGAALLLAPGSLFMGTLFPAGVLAVPGRDLERGLLADAMGALAGFALSYLILLPFGIRAFLAAAFALYAGAAAALSSRAGWALRD